MTEFKPRILHLATMINYKGNLMEDLVKGFYMKNVNK